jgi:hypothetical protein
MLKISPKIVVGTKVKLEHSSEWFEVSHVHETRFWIKVKGLEGSFQKGHIVCFTNYKMPNPKP